MMKKEKHFFPVFLLLATLAVLVYSASENGSEDVRKALELCAQRLVPSIFISVTLSGFLVKSGLYTLLSKPFSFITGKVFGLPEYCGAPIALGFLCGFPCGAASASELYRQKRLTASEAADIAAFSSLPSLPFFMNFVGSGVFSSLYIGISLYICCLFASCVTGSILPVIHKEHSTEKYEAKTEIKLVKPLSSALSDAVTKTLSACAAVVFFSVVCGITAHIPGMNRGFCAAVCGVFELCGGVSMLKYLPLEPSAVLAAALCGFSGLSVFMQICTCCSDARLKIPAYILTKLIIAVLSAGFAAVLFYLPPVFSSLTFLCSLALAFLLRKAFSGSLRIGIFRRKREVHRI